MVFHIHNPFEADLSEVLAAYRNFGDRFSGFYGINYSSQEAQEILRKMKEIRQVADMDTTFCAEYLLSLLAAENKPLQIVCVPTLQDNTGSRRSEEDVNGMIRYSSQQMFRTRAGSRLKSHASKKETVDNLARFYPKDEVALVQKLMLKEN